MSEPTMRDALLGLIVATAFAAGAVAACSGPPADARIGISTPDRALFDPVGKYLGLRCGMLTCHGSSQRNFIVWSCFGLRLDPSDVSGCRASGGKDTTAGELDATYRSLVGLEPTVMSTVVSEGGKRPELLTFVRKARGDESHKGGALVVPGDDQDNCITGWLSGNADQTNAACAKAVTDFTP